MLNQIKTLLADAQLRQQVKEANSLEDAISLLKTTDAIKDDLSYSDILNSKLPIQKSLENLGEQELLMITGGFDGGKGWTNQQSC